MSYWESLNKDLFCCLRVRMCSDGSQRSYQDVEKMTNAVILLARTVRQYNK